MGTLYRRGRVWWAGALAVVQVLFELGVMGPIVNAATSGGV